LSQRLLSKWGGIQSYKYTDTDHLNKTNVDKYIFTGEIVHNKQNKYTKVTYQS